MSETNVLALTESTAPTARLYTVYHGRANSNMPKPCGVQPPESDPSEANTRKRQGLGLRVAHTRPMAASMRRRAQSSLLLSGPLPGLLLWEALPPQQAVAPWTRTLPHICGAISKALLRGVEQLGRGP